MSVAPLTRRVGGRLGLTRCPGAYGDADIELSILRGRGVDVLATLLSDDALLDMDLLDLPERALSAGLVVVRFPIDDFGIPSDASAFRTFVLHLVDRVHDGKTVVIHCYAGLGRSGTVAACVLVELGLGAEDAIAIVRQARRGAIESEEQEAFVASYQTSVGAGTACPNFRDVALGLQRLLGRTPIPERRLYRGGRLDLVTSHAEIGVAATIINLRASPDRVGFGALLVHVPADNDLERYETRNPRVRRWLARVLRSLADEQTQLPVLVHCLSGKDRTGVVVAAVLRVLDVPRDAIVAEYLLSEGDVRRDRIEAALDGMADPTRYFHAVDLARLRRKLTR